MSMVFAAQCERVLVRDEHRAGWGLPAVRRTLEDGLRRRVDDVGDAGRERGVAGCVVAVVRADDDVLDRLRCDRPNRVDQALRLRRAPLAVRHQHAVRGDDEHVGRGELLGAGVEILVGVDVVGDFDRARKVAFLQAAGDRIGGAHNRLRKGGAGGEDGENETDGEPSGSEARHSQAPCGMASA